MTTDEVYALVIKGTVDIQGLVALEKDDDAKAIYISWMVAAPQNNKMLTEEIRNLGVGDIFLQLPQTSLLNMGMKVLYTGLLQMRICLNIT